MLQAAPDIIENRRNFAIISHPDAGKTTLTEKLLLYGGAIQEAGAVRSKQAQRSSTSDFMELEKKRGISITSTVLSFAYKGKHINLLDTPGHQDFSEDTYRTLAAADNVVMVVDAAKGLEPQTRKLFEVCRMRLLPIFTFVNKMDRPSLTPMELIDQIEAEFQLPCTPATWPIGSGPDFKGVLDRSTNQVFLFGKGTRSGKADETGCMELDDEGLLEELGEELHAQLMEDVEIIDEMMPAFDQVAVDEGKLSPIYFGSAMNNFGIELFLKHFLRSSSPPLARHTDAGTITPEHPEFTAFVFKLQANLDPKHRDRMAFARICSGTFERGMKVKHHRMRDRQLTLSQAQTLFASERETVNIAFPGDVIGLNNPGHFAIGDTIYTGNSKVQFPGIPSFSPEIFAYLRNPDPSKYKSFQKGLQQLLDEGAVQLLREKTDQGSGIPILAAVGQLQFEVVQSRLESEYGVESLLEPLSFSVARWVEGGWEQLDKLGPLFSNILVAKDRWNQPVLLFRNQWSCDNLLNDNEGLSLMPWAFPAEIE